MLLYSMVVKHECSDHKQGAHSLSQLFIESLQLFLSMHLIDRPDETIWIQLKSNSTVHVLP